MNRPRQKGALSFIACGLRIVILLSLSIQAVAQVTEIDDSGEEASALPPDAKRLSWHRQTLVADYKNVGHHSAAWDATVYELLETWVTVRANPNTNNADRIRQVTAGVIKAINAGCDDPFIAYLHVRLVRSQESTSKAKLAELSASTARNLSQSRYSDWLKFYGHLRASEALVQAYRVTRDTNEAARIWSSVGRHRRAAGGYLASVIRQAAAPTEELHISIHELLDELGPVSSGEFCRTVESDLQKLDSHDPVVWLLRADFYRSFAWAVRGNARAEKVPPSAWPIFEERLKKADEAIRRAWELDPKDVRIPVAGIHVELGLGGERSKMEQWFDRAMKLDTNSMLACRAKMYYLEPKWHGSPEEMLAFGRTCASSRAWGGRVPLVLVDAHRRLASYLPPVEKTNYWRRPNVWRDVKKSYDTYFVRNPTQQAQTGTFAQYAYQCEQWAAFLSHVEVLSKEYREQFFGGTDKYNSMVAAAKARLGDNKLESTPK